MNTPYQYSRAPIVEAILDLRVTLSDDMSVDEIAKRMTNAVDDYRDQRMQIIGTRITISTAPEVTTTVEPAQHVQVFLHNGGKQTYQVSRSGFTFSRLAPYQGWDPFLAEALRLWNIYRKCINVATVERAALRYINRLTLPLPIADLADYLRTAPQIAPDLPQDLGSYYMQVQFPLMDGEGILRLTEATLASESTDTVPIVLDIDIFRLDVPRNDEGLVNCFTDLRTRKNAAFEACITDRVRELIQ